ncbi:MAG: tRNA uridine-5-carboxymethylaminomethyl(34) synthesis GTPase MnmE [Clostridia bacterium]|nr:tRNA uridine-5-carboxymethylaminomethyl(34) synthesis GTPase MnmE [Clostridia bacterium]
MSGTICAISTNASKASGINIIRMSGENSKEIIDRIFESKKIINKEMIPNMMYLGLINGGTFFEKALCVYFKAPYSYTGEDLVEIHCHGGIGVTQAILRILVDNGARIADPGEFSKRAFLNSKITLSEADGIFDMINAETEGQVRNAYKLMSGELTKGIYEGEKELEIACSMLEAKLDYPEEVEEDVFDLAKEKISIAKANAEAVLSKSKRAKTLNKGIDIAIVGIPNAGKSSLLNALLNEDRAIVSNIEGTTRDIIKESIEIEGLRINFLDTAGIRENEEVGEIEKLGIERSEQAIKKANICIFVQDSTKPNTPEEKRIEDLLKDSTVIKVVNKTDISKYPKEGILVSAKTGEGIDKLIEKIMDLSDQKEIFTEGVITSERHIFALNECIKYLDSALVNIDSLPAECTLADIKLGLKELGKITGHDATEEIINEVFSRFCVGK